jgi:hypothetical protein
MAALGFQANASGAAALNASARATAAWTQRVPPLTVNLNALSLLAALLAALGLIQSALGVNLRAPQASASLQAALRPLPLAALGALRVGATARAQATARASATASLVAALKLQAAARANLTAAMRLALMMRLTASASGSGLLAVPGACGACPIAPPKASAALRLA